MSQMGQAATWRLIRDESVHPSISEVLGRATAGRLLLRGYAALDLPSFDDARISAAVCKQINCNKQPRRWAGASGKLRP
jgi:hypothetical protein